MASLASHLVHSPFVLLHGAFGWFDEIAIVSVGLIVMAALAIASRRRRKRRQKRKPPKDS